MHTRAATPATTPSTTRPDTQTQPRETDDGDHDRFSHYVPKEELERSKRTGEPVTALCGKRWVPDGDPTRYPMCPTCAELMADSFDPSDL